MAARKAKVDENGGTRTAILDATERLMLEEGYAAVSTRRVSSAAGLRSNLLYYHFKTLDDLFVAVFQRLEERYDERFARAIASDKPLRELWALAMDSAATGLLLEFKALATHRKPIRAVIARSARRDRKLHVAALSQILARAGLQGDGLTPTVLSLLIASVARTLVTEEALDVADGHAEMVAFVEGFLTKLESNAPTLEPSQG